MSDSWNTRRSHLAAQVTYYEQRALNNDDLRGVINAILALVKAIEYQTHMLKDS